MTTTPEQNVQLDLKTSLGTMRLELYPAKAPKTVANFLQYVDDGFYADTIFHRVIENFVIQGGGFTADMNQKKTKAPIPNEADNGLKNVKGSISMARTNDPNSATTQFFVSLADNDFLNHRGKTADQWGYAVFGQLIGGMDVLEKIGKIKTGRAGGHSDVPVEPVVLQAVTRAQTTAPA